MIAEGNVLSITCPDAQCRKQGKILFPEVKKLVDDKSFTRYRKIRYQKEVDLDPHRTFCPEAGCETVCHVCSTSTSDAITRPTPVDCPTCGLQFCSVCKSRWHHAKSCDEVIMSGRLEDQGIPFNCVENSEIKRCPVCHVPIERNDGCAQMMCKRCKHVFCWYCLTSLDDDFLLRHYDKGPCKNKLGHSRASVIWHRTQGYRHLCWFWSSFTCCLTIPVACGTRILYAVNVKYVSAVKMMTGNQYPPKHHQVT
ncbi:probable E3 ubiquitin-protein ligase RNF144A-A [Ruditapes philippinarum]|uniref:probable E3 ubiquitin-protein ligase RNF144A-A n=1 Tax=Ruditapes philippinarum TaxID=129788 RepID=UPI00295A92CA|nr:probable E3 ubiquitin-protein ligase RNF144A-A [Ruditapes philippinarum]